jgi:rod shape-determining protein MreB and related proteins
MRNLNFFPKKSFGIDLGNNNTVVSDREKVLFAQPSYIVLDREKKNIKAVGEDAFDMFEKNHSELKPVKPLRGGVIADHSSAMKMIHAMMEQAYGTKSFLSGYENIISGIPYYTTNVERRALKAVLEQFNAHSVSLVFEPIAAAIGMGLDISEPNGKMVVDIGGGITEIVIISLSGIASCQSIKVAGDTMDEEIQHYFRRKHNMAIGLKTAEQVKIQVGSVIDNLAAPPTSMTVRGKDLMRGIPVTRTIDHYEVCSILDKSFASIELAIQQTLEKCPPELAADIYENGIHVTGGNALLRGIKERLHSKMKIDIHIDSGALTSVSRGVAATLNDRKKYRPVLIE